MNEENNNFDEIKINNIPKKKNKALTIIIVIVAFMAVCTALAFTFKDTLMYTFSPKTYLVTALGKTSDKLTDEINQSMKNNKFFNDINNFKYENAVSTISLAEETSSLLGFPSNLNVSFSNDTKAERFAIDLKKIDKPIFSFSFSNDKAVVSIRDKFYYFTPETFPQDYNKWIVTNKQALGQYGATLPDSISESTKFSYPKEYENTVDTELEKTLTDNLKKLIDTATVEKQNVDYKLGDEIVPSKEIKLTFASKDLQEFYNKSLEAALADKNFYAQLEVQATSYGMTIEDMISTLKEIKTNGDISVKFNIYKDIVVGTNVNIIGADTKMALILKANNKENLISDFSIELASDQAKINLNVSSDLSNKDVITTTSTLNANGMILGTVKTTWDQTKTTDNLQLTVSEIPPLFGIPDDISLLFSAYTENGAIIFNVGKLTVATESIDVGFSSKTEEQKNEIAIPETDVKLFDLTGEELISSLQ